MFSICNLKKLCLTRALNGIASSFPPIFRFSISVVQFVSKTKLACTRLIRNVVDQATTQD